ncbi:MAG: hypothetical protein B7Y99_03135 [Caulobacterales bacterium 32-69-10]|nr:MAG: hypothetical protein B7Y99_03135 [Caulobacterales bacterium 32-69-10]
MSPLDEYDAVVFDCDGVLLDTNGMKIDAFKAVVLAAGFDEQTAERFSAFQSVNFGLSRHVLFDRLLGGEFGSAPGHVTKAQLLGAYGDACRRGYLTADQTEGMADLLSSIGRPLFVVSGSDEAELIEVFERRSLRRHFVCVFGSPTAKFENLQRVRSQLEAAGIRRPRLLFVGDAEADANAAARSGADFVFMARHSTVKDSMTARANAGEFPMVECLTGLTC